jgi:hypothetical protein
MTGRIDKALIGFDEVSDLGEIALDRDARLLYVEMLTWSCLNSTDGYVTARALKRVTDHPDPEAGCAALISAGRLTAVAGGWQLAEYDQLDSEQKRKWRDSGAERQRKWRERRFGGSKASNSVTGAATHPATNAKRAVAKRSEADGTSTARSAPPPLRSGVAPLAQARAEELAELWGVPSSFVDPSDEDMSRLYEAGGLICEACDLIATEDDLVTVTRNGVEAGMAHPGECARQLRGDSQL